METNKSVASRINETPARGVTEQFLWWIWQVYFLVYNITMKIHCMLYDLYCEFEVLKLLS